MDQINHPDRYIIVGLSQLGLLAAQDLLALGKEVTVVRGAEGDELEPLISAHAKVIRRQWDLDATLEEAGLRSADGLLALSDDELDNLKAALAARSAAPHVPVTLQALDPGLADQLKEGLQLRAAHSVSTLASTAIVAAAFGQRTDAIFTIGRSLASIQHFEVRTGSPIVGRTASEIGKKYCCSVIAYAPGGGEWTIAPDDRRIQPGDHIAAGGLLYDILDLGRQNHDPRDKPRSRRDQTSRRRARKREVARAFHLPRQPGGAEQTPETPPPVPRSTGYTLLPWIGITFVVIVVACASYFHAALKLSWLSAFYFVISMLATAGANVTIITRAPAIKIVTALMLILGTALIAVLISHLASVATEKRIAVRMGQRRCENSEHVVLCGLGKVGYRVAQHLVRLGVDLTVIDRSPDPRFVDALREFSVILTGDARFPENLQRVGAEDAAVFIACTNDTVANLETCLHARRLNPDVGTVARVFRERVAAQMSEAFHLDAAISSTRAAAGAFVGAALGPGIPQAFVLGNLELQGRLYTIPAGFAADSFKSWRSRGVVPIAIRRAGQPEQPAAILTEAPQPGDELLLCGPASEMQNFDGAVPLSAGSGSAVLGDGAKIPTPAP